MHLGQVDWPRIKQICKPNSNQQIHCALREVETTPGAQKSTQAGTWDHSAWRRSKNIIAVASTALASTALAATLLVTPLPAMAAAKPPITCPDCDSRVLGRLKFKGLFLGPSKVLTLKVFSDPKIEGLTLYLSYQDPTTMSLACQAAPKGARLAKDVTSVQELMEFPSIDTEPSSKTALSAATKDVPAQVGEIIFQESRRIGTALVGGKKYVTVRRFYDEENHNLVYMASSPRDYTYDGSYRRQYTSSICVVPLCQ